MNPGATTWPLASMACRQAALASFPIAAIRPSRIPKSAAYQGDPVASTSRPFLIIISKPAGWAGAKGIWPRKETMQAHRNRRLENMPERSIQAHIFSISQGIPLYSTRSLLEGFSAGRGPGWLRFAHAGDLFDSSQTLIRVLCHPTATNAQVWIGGGLFRRRTHEFAATNADLRLHFDSRPCPNSRLNGARVHRISLVRRIWGESLPLLTDRPWVESPSAAD